MTLRQAASRTRRLLLDFPCKVRGRTVSFAGFGYGSAGFIHIECDVPLPPHAITNLEDFSQQIKAEGGSTVILSLEGPAYPFAHTIGKK